MKDVSFRVDGLTLQGKLFLSESDGQKKPAVLLIHGWESEQNRMFALAEDLFARGYQCMTFDLRGHGASEGDHKLYSRKQCLNDALAAYDFLVAQPDIDPDRVIAVGSSFGSYLAALLSAERKLQGLALRVPADYRDADFDEPLYEQRSQWEHSHWKEQLHAASETAALRAIHAFDGSILIVESEKDEVVPAPTVKSYANAAPNPQKLTYILMQNAPHSITRFPEFQKEFAGIVCSWLGSVQ